MYKKVVTEISRNFDDDEQDMLGRIRCNSNPPLSLRWYLTIKSRVVGLDCHEQDPFDVDVVGKRFGVQMKNLLDGKPVRCTNTNTELPALRPPATLLVDVSIEFLLLFTIR